MRNLINQLKLAIAKQNSTFVASFSSGEAGGGGFGGGGGGGSGGGFGGEGIDSPWTIGQGSPVGHCSVASVTSTWTINSLQNAANANRKIPDLHREGYNSYFNDFIKDFIIQEISRLQAGMVYCTYSFAFDLNEPVLGLFLQEASDVLQEILDGVNNSDAFQNYKDSLEQHFRNFNLTNFTSVNSIGLRYLDCKKIKSIMDNATTSERVAYYSRIRDAIGSLPEMPNEIIGSNENSSDGIQLNHVFSPMFSIRGIYAASLIEKIKASSNFRISLTLPAGGSGTPTWVTKAANNVAAAYATSFFEDICAALGFLDLTSKRQKLSKLFEDCIMEDILGSNLTPEQKCALLNSNGNHPNNPINGLGVKAIYAKYMASCVEGKLATLCVEPNFRNAGPAD